MPVKPVYQGEAQLVRWAESPVAGRTLTIRLDEEGDIHPFKGLTCGENGIRMQVVCVLIDDQELAVDPDKARRAPRGAKKPQAAEQTKERKRFAEMPRSQQAGMRIKESAFHQWVVAHHTSIWNRAFADAELNDDGSGNSPTDRALKYLCGIKSKTELDVPGPKAEAFDRLLTSFEYRDRA